MIKLNRRLPWLRRFNSVPVRAILVFTVEVASFLTREGTSPKGVVEDSELGVTQLSVMSVVEASEMDCVILSILSTTDPSVGTVVFDSLLGVG